MQGLRIEVPQGTGDPAILEQALDDAFNYRGDVTIALDDGSTLEGFLFDRRRGAALDSSFVRLILKDSDEKRSLPWSRIRSVVFSGKDPAAGKTWENWVKRYAEKKLKGEAAGIESEPLE